MKRMLGKSSFYDEKMRKLLAKFNHLKKSGLPFDVEFNLLSDLLADISIWHPSLDAHSEPAGQNIVVQKAALCYLAIDILIRILSLITKEPLDGDDIREIAELTLNKFNEYRDTVADASNAMSDIFCKQATLDFIAIHNSSRLNSIAAIDNCIKTQELTNLIEFVEGTKLANVKAC